MTKLPRAVRASLGVYRALLVLYPAAFRNAYGEEMRDVFEELSREGWQRRGWLGLCGVWLRVAIDLAYSVPKQHQLACTGASPMKTSLCAAFGLGVVLIVAGWIVDSASAGDPHWLDGIGLAILVVTAVAAALVPAPAGGASGGARFWFGHRRVLVSAALALVVGGLMFTFAGERVFVERQWRPFAVSPLHELLALGSLAIVFALAFAALSQIEQLQPARRSRTLWIALAWGSASILVVVAAAVWVVYLLVERRVHPPLELVGTLTLAVGLVVLLSVVTLVLSMCNRRPGCENAT